MCVPLFATHLHAHRPGGHMFCSLDLAKSLRPEPQDTLSPSHDPALSMLTSKDGDSVQNFILEMALLCFERLKVTVVGR